MKLALIFALTLACAGVVFAQEKVTGGPASPPDPLLDRMGRDPSPYTRSVTGTIVAVVSSQGMLMLELPDKTHLRVVTDARVRLRSDKGTSLADKKDITLSDYKRGDLVTIKYRIEDTRVIEVRLRRPKN